MRRARMATLEGMCWKVQAKWQSIWGWLSRSSDACQRRNSADQAISAYYNSLSNEEKKEQEAWGEFAVAQLKQEPK